MNSSMNTGPSFSDAMRMDEAIYNLASYDACKGLIVVPKSAEEAMEFQRLVAKRFNYFKRLLQDSEMSFLELQRSIVDKNGAFPNYNNNMTLEESVDQIINNPNESELPELPELSESATKVLSKLFGDILKISGDNAKLLKSCHDLDDLSEEELEELEKLEELEGLEGLEGLEDIPPEGKNVRKRKTNKNGEGESNS